VFLQRPAAGFEGLLGRCTPRSPVLGPGHSDPNYAATGYAWDCTSERILLGVTRLAAMFLVRAPTG
jgi:hypothetical protein